MKAFAGRRSWRAAAAGLAVSALVTGGIALLTAGGDDSTAARGEASAASSRSCHSELRRGVLPKWARGGFTDGAPRIPHVLGRSNEIAAILFGDPLRWPPSKERNNKILWVERRALTASADLHIDAQRMQGTRKVGSPVRVVVEGGPGPSIVDLPGAGCWRLSLSWSGRSDTLDLRYERIRHE